MISRAEVAVFTLARCPRLIIFVVVYRGQYSVQIYFAYCEFQCDFAKNVEHCVNTNTALIAHDLFVMNQNNTKYFYFKMYTGYKVHRLCAQSGLRVLMNLADSLFLPYNLKRFPEQMKKSLEKLTNKYEIMEVRPRSVEKAQT